MSDSPLVSVVVPAYNCAPYIELTLDSALTQDYPNKEIIVVNDGSTDTTRAILERYKDHIRIIDQPNAGVATARSNGVAAARGDYIAFLDADDYWYPGKLTMQVAYLESHPSVGIAYHGWMVWKADANGRFLVPPAPVTDFNDFSIDASSSGWVYNNLFFDCIIHTTTAMVRRDVARQIGAFDPTLRIGEDYEYWIRASRIAPIHKLKAVLSLYRIHESSITKKPLDKNYAAIVMQRSLDKWGRVGPDGNETPKREVDRQLARLWYRFGYQHRMNGDPRIARDAFWRAVALRPAWISAWVNWLRMQTK